MNRMFMVDPDSFLGGLDAGAVVLLAGGALVPGFHMASIEISWALPIAWRVLFECQRLCTAFGRLLPCKSDGAGIMATASRLADRWRGWLAHPRAVRLMDRLIQYLFYTNIRVLVTRKDDFPGCSGRFFQNSSQSASSKDLRDESTQKRFHKIAHERAWSHKPT